MRQFNDTVREVFALTPRELRQRRGRAERRRPGHDRAAPPLPRADRARARCFAFFALARDRGRRGGTAGGRLPADAAAPARHGDRGAGARRRLRAVLAAARRRARPRRRRRALPPPARPRRRSRRPSRRRWPAIPLLAPLVARASRACASRAASTAPRSPCARCSASRSRSRRRARTRRASSQRHGEPLAAPDGSLTHVFPSAAALAEADDDVLAMPQRRRETLRGVCAALRDGLVELDAGADRERARRDLLALPGIGPWTVEYVAMRALGDPDAFPASDLGVLHAPARARRRGRRARGGAPLAGLAAVPRLHRPAPVGRARERRRRRERDVHDAPSPVGELLLTAEDGRLTGLYLPADRDARHAAAHPGAARARRRGVRGGAAAARRSTSPASARRSTCPVAPAGTPFQQRVWERAAAHRLRRDDHVRRARARGSAGPRRSAPPARRTARTPSRS